MSSIQPLPPEVIAQIKSSIAITSLNGVICQLVKNSLDASSTKIDINVDYTRGGCVVEDDGLGIQPFEFGEGGGLGKLYHSSKLNNHNPVHGGRGTFVAALSAMALITITSHHHLHCSHNTISMHKSEVVSRQTPAPAQQHLSHSNHGTRVTVRDLFGNMPVRVKQRAIAAEKHRGNQKEWEELKRDIVTLLLSWPRHVAITVRELNSNQKLSIRPLVHCSEGADSGIEVSRVCGILTQAALISPDEKTSWVPVGISTSTLDIHGFVSLHPSAVKHIQFISFGVHPLKVGGQSILHDNINKLFFNSSFGNEEEMADLDDTERAKRAKDQRFKGDGYTNKELKGGRKGVERWPMFYINIGQPSTSELARQLDPDGNLDDTGSNFGAISELLQVMITKFLTLHHFRPKPGRRKHPKRNEDEIASSSHLGSPRRVEASENSIQAIAETKELSSRHNPLSFDPLGTNIKLPSFCRSLSKPENPLESWSKIKSGAQREGRPVPAIARPSSAPLQTTSKEYFPVRRSNTPLIAKDGKILRQPFDDTVTLTSRSKSSRTTLLSPANSQTVDEDDEIVAWINPITKVRCMVNKRTGMTAPDKNEMSGQRISQKPHLFNQVSNNIPSTKTNSSNSWIKGILQNWNNPIFSTAEPAIPQISLEGPDQHTQSILHGRHHHCSQLDIDRAFKESSAGVSGRISKVALRNAEVIAQVDRKFILVSVQAGSSHDGNSVLVLVDQHAADERIRIEALMEALCTPPEDPALLAESPVLTTPLNKPLVFEISIREVQILKEQRLLFANWGIIYEVNSSENDSINTTAMYRLSVFSLPPGINERCKQEPRLLADLIRTEAWRAHESGKAPPDRVSIRQQTWLQQIQSCPQGILDMLNSRACRGAIMFNDELSKGQCETLVRRLADCKFPFQCAHGRPSLVPLVNMSMLKDVNDEDINNLGGGRYSTFGHAFRKWKQNSV